MRTFLYKSIITLFLLSACNLLMPGQLIPFRETSQDFSTTECAFMWANEALPELSEDFNQALQNTLADAEGYAQAYGENCVTNDGEVIRFLAMETDFYITLKVESIDEKQLLGELVEQAMVVLAEFPTEETPGPQPGYIGIIFETPGDSLRLWVMVIEVESALEDGLQGEELFDTLSEK
jgi:hypothetical protein